MYNTTWPYLFWKIFIDFLTSTLLRAQNTTLLSKVRRRFFQILWPSQKTQTLNHGLFFKVVEWKYILNWIENSGLKSRLLYCFRSQVFTWCTSWSARNQPIFICQNGWAEQLLSNVYSTYLGCITLLMILTTTFSPETPQKLKSKLEIG